MRTTFLIDLRCDIDATNDAQRDAFITLTKKTAELYFSQASMLADKPPTITVSSTSRRGRIDHPLFDHTSE